MTIKLYLANLAQYNNGKLIGKWVELPMDEDELQEEISSILGNDEEIAIHDYESPFSIGEYDNITRLNEIAEMLENVDHYDNEVVELILGNYSDVEEGLQVIENENFTVHHDCNSMSDIAYGYIEDCGTLDNVPDDLQRYFDYEAFGRDMEIEGTFLKGSGLYVEIYN